VLIKQFSLTEGKQLGFFISSIRLLFPADSPATLLCNSDAMEADIAYDCKLYILWLG
jgi:hypothetical protein